jgi:hypothetical protein
MRPRRPFMQETMAIATAVDGMALLRTSPMLLPSVVSRVAG